MPKLTKEFYKIDGEEYVTYFLNKEIKENKIIISKKDKSTLIKSIYKAIIDKNINPLIEIKKINEVILKTINDILADNSSENANLRKIENIISNIMVCYISPLNDIQKKIKEQYDEILKNYNKSDSKHTNFNFYEYILKIQ